MPSSVIMFWCIFCTVKENRCWFGNPFALSSVCLLGPHNYYWWWCDDADWQRWTHTHNAGWCDDDDVPVPILCYFYLCLGVMIAELTRTFGGRRRRGPSHLPYRGHSTRPMFVNTTLCLHLVNYFFWISLKMKYPTYRPPSKYTFRPFFSARVISKLYI